MPSEAAPSATYFEEVGCSYLVTCADKLLLTQSTTMEFFIDNPPTNILEAILALLRWLGRVLQWLSF